NVYATLQKDDAKALAAYKSALEAASAAEKEAIKKQIPAAYLARI
ncbi:MAG: hypothetical protein H7Z77_06010, partial [Chitinophagaceae bacterium]|nr:hypothetical protein [Polaromonas sp.]